MDLVLLHGAVGFWDEIACLVVPATIVMGVALVVLRQDQGGARQGETGDAAAADPEPARADDAAPPPSGGAAGRAERR